MDRKLKQRKNEPLYKWCERIAETLGMTEEQTEALKEICGRWNPVLALEAEQDEYAIATMLFDMKEYLDGGAEVYPLREALEDAYEWLLIQEAVKRPGETIVSEPMPYPF